MMTRLAALICALLAAAVAAEPVKIVSVVDGDTVWVERGTDAIKIRIRYIDAPESCQPHGAEAADVMRRIALGKPAELKITGRSYDRYVGTIEINGVDLAGAMVTYGAAWVYRQATPKKSPLRAQEDAARASKTGLWADTNPVPPWEFRKSNRCPHGKASK